MTRARLDMAGMSLEWLQKQVPNGSAAELVDFALNHGTTYGSFASRRSPHESPEAKAWYDESKAMALKLVAGEVPELAEECERQLNALSA